MSTGTPRPQDPASPVRFRRNADRLTASQLQLLRDAFEAVYSIGDDRGYAYHAGIHGLPLPIGCDNAHGTPYFLPWHRAYLYFFERALRDRVPAAMLTWWDWRAGPQRPARVPEAFSRRTVAGRRNPLFSAEVPRLALDQGRGAGMTVGRRTRREPGDPALLPTPVEVLRVLELREFLDFTAALEDLHNRVHVWTGGHMAMVPFAAFDPIFWAHHTMCDRLWRIWQLRRPGARPPRAILDEALPPFRMTVRQTLDVTALGYDYAVASSSSAVETRR
jgi:tyrosinase